MVRILVFGTSADHGFWDKKGGWVQRLRKKLDKYSMQNETSYSIYNLSISGNMTEDIEARAEQEIDARANTEDLQIYMQLGGGNDSQINLETGDSIISVDEHQKYVQRCIQIAQQYTDDVVLFTGTPYDEKESYPMNWKPTHGYKNSRAREYSNTLRSISDNDNIPIVDFEKRVDSRGWRNNMLADGVHPNTEGHRLMYEVAKDELSEMGYIPL